MLKNAGADANLKAQDRSANDIYYENGGKTAQFLLTQLTKEFKSEGLELNSLYAQLPDKNKFSTDEENAQFDLNRLKYITLRIGEILQ